MGTPVSPNAKAEDTVFNGKIEWVKLSISDDDQSHLIQPEDYMHMVMRKQ
jgi:hypothetical protein